MASSGKVLLPDDPRHIERVWWNGIDARADGCAFVALGTVPGDLGWFVRRSDTEQWTRFERRQEALAVAQLMTRGWTPVIVSLGETAHEPVTNGAIGPAGAHAPLKL